MTTIRYSHDYYNKKLKPFAKHLRNNSTKGEIKLWIYALRARQLKGYQFLRQRTVSSYIADFFCKELKLIVEVDGITHKNRIERDRSKDEKLIGLGYTIIRIPDYDIFTNLSGVIKRLENWVDEYEKIHPEVLELKRKGKSHPPSPLQRGKEEPSP
jgi:very-short-patch-repair endonuclease